MALNTITPLTEYAFKVASIDRLVVKPGEIPVPDKEAITVTFEYETPDTLTLAEQNYEFIQTEDLTEAGIAVQPYGAILINTLAPTTLAELTLSLKTAGGVLVSDVSILDILDDGVGTAVTFAEESEGGGGESEGT